LANEINADSAENGKVSTTRQKPEIRDYREAV
jgi:hypothetical protein